MYNSERFLEFAKTHIGAEIEKDMLNQIKDIIRSNREARVARQRRLTSEQKQHVDEMIDWFFENYEDPANGVPFESAEGGYQYVFGGPYDAREELENHFDEVASDEIDEAVERIEDQGYEWVKVGEY